MAAFLSPLGGAGWQFFNDQGNVLAGGLLYTYSAGTTTPIATYTTSTQTVANANPIVLNAEGRPPQEIWLASGQQYKFVLADATNVVVTPGTWDNISGINDTNFSQSEWINSGLAPTFITSTTFSVLGNQTTIFNQFRRLQLFVTAGTVYGNVSTAVYNGINATTITLSMDFGQVLDSGLSAVNYDFISVVTSGSVEYIYPATGSTPISLQQNLNQYASVLSFGVDPTGATDSTTQLQAAINAVQGNNATLYFPAGTYKYGTSGTGLTISGSVRFKGAAYFDTALNYNFSTGNGITVTSTSSVTFEDLTFTQAANPTSGSQIIFQPISGENDASQIRNCVFDVPFIGIDFVAAASWIIHGCEFNQHVSSGILVQNTNNVDSGDSVISDCIFSGASGSVGIGQYSSGGLKIVGNKIIGGAYGYLNQLAVGANTSDLLFVGNSVEGHTSGGLVMTRQGSSGTFANVVISGNQFAQNSGGNNISLGNGTAGWLSNVTICGNALDINSATSITISGVTAFNISGNNILGQGGAPQGISVNSASVNGTIGYNTYNALTTSITNSSASTAVAQRTFVGSASITCSTTDGALFSGSSSVTFPSGFFQSTPSIIGSITGGNGVGVGSASVTTGGASITATATTNGAVVPVVFTAFSNY